VENTEWWIAGSDWILRTWLVAADHRSVRVRVGLGLTLAINLDLNPGIHHSMFFPLSPKIIY